MFGGLDFKTDLKKIHSLVGSNEFTWDEVKNLGLKTTPQYFRYAGGLKIVGKNKKNSNIYKIPDGLFTETKYKIKKKPLYPEKMWKPNINFKNGEADIKIIVVMVCVSAVAVLVGYMLMQGVETAGMPTMTHSVLSTSSETVLQGFGQSATTLTIGIFAVAAIFIVTILGGILGKNE